MNNSTIAYGWAAPCSAIGLLLAGIAAAFGARWRLHSGVIEVALTNHRSRHARALRCLPFSAITFGHVVIGQTVGDLNRLRVHERAHVAQFERWGLLLLLAYPVASLVQWLRGRHAYLDNPFEVRAREAEASSRRVSKA
jgi:hypothetical protein